MSVRGELRRRSSQTIIKPPRTLTHKTWPPNYEDIHIWRNAQIARFELDASLLRHAKAYYATHPIEWINHWCDTHDPRNVGTDRPVWMPFVLFKRQEQLVQFLYECYRDEQPGLIEKCRTMGATWIGVGFSAWLWLFYSGVAIGWGSRDGPAVDELNNPKSIFWKIRELIKRLPTVFQPQGLEPNHLKHMVCFNPEKGSSIIGEVGDNIGRGGRTRIYFKDESAHYERPEAIEASLSETTRVPIDISSVNGLGNLFHRKRETGLDWSPGTQIEAGYTRVFVMDWRDHPEYTQAWYEEKKLMHERQGTQNIFAQEIERNYSAAVQGTIIPAEWVSACVDAHVKLKLEPGEVWGSALDVADEGLDTNAQVFRRGIVLCRAEEWGERDVGVTARRAVGNCDGLGKVEVQYDAAGVGAAVKAEINRLEDEGLLPKKVKFIPWMAGGKVLHPQDRVVEDDRDSPRNKDFYANLKAQGWWELRSRVYRTWQAVTQDIKHDPDSLISIDGKLPLLYKVMKEMSQPTASKGSKLKLVVDKTPEGTKSPNIGDAVMMAYWPLPRSVGPFAMLGGVPKIFVDGKVAYR